MLSSESTVDCCMHGAYIHRHDRSATGLTGEMVVKKVFARLARSASKFSSSYEESVCEMCDVWESRKNSWTSLKTFSAVQKTSSSSALRMFARSRASQRLYALSCHPTWAEPRELSQHPPSGPTFTFYLTKVLIVEQVKAASSVKFLAKSERRPKLRIGRFRASKLDDQRGVPTDRRSQQVAL